MELMYIVWGAVIICTGLTVTAFKAKPQQQQTVDEIDWRNEEEET